MASHLSRIYGTEQDKYVLPMHFTLSTRFSWYPYDIMFQKFDFSFPSLSLSFAGAFSWQQDCFPFALLLLHLSFPLLQSIPYQYQKLWKSHFMPTTVTSVIKRAQSNDEILLCFHSEALSPHKPTGSSLSIFSINQKVIIRCNFIIFLVFQARLQPFLPSSTRPAKSN